MNLTTWVWQWYPIFGIQLVGRHLQGDFQKSLTRSHILNLQLLSMKELHLRVNMQIPLPRYYLVDIPSQNSIPHQISINLRILELLANICAHILYLDLRLHNIQCMIQYLNPTIKYRKIRYFRIGLFLLKNNIPLFTKGLCCSVVGRKGYTISSIVFFLDKRVILWCFLTKGLWERT